LFEAIEGKKFRGKASWALLVCAKGDFTLKKKMPGGEGFRQNRTILKVKDPKKKKKNWGKRGGGGKLKRP